MRIACRLLTFDSQQPTADTLSCRTERANAGVSRIYLPERSNSQVFSTRYIPNVQNYFYDRVCWIIV